MSKPITGTVYVRRPAGDIVLLSELTADERLALQKKLAPGLHDLCWQTAERIVRERTAASQGGVRHDQT